MQGTDPATAPLLSEARERSLNEDLQQLAQDARAYAEAELQFQKSRAAFTAGATKNIAVLAIAALVLVFFATMALVIGLVIALAPLITAWGSTALVTLVLLAIAGILLMRAKKQYDRMMAVVGEGKTP